MKLKIASDFSFPLDIATQTISALGMRGSGKSNAAVVLAEEMFRAKIHWVAIDPKGDWWGMRSAKNGKKAGLPIVVFGGRHGDVPLEPASGPMLADLIVGETITCILDLSEFTEGEKIRFLGGAGGQDGFAARFYKRKSPEQQPTHLFLEEADDYLPQKAMRDKAKLLHDCSKLYLWGRQRGVGGTLITQRSARIHKDVLTQSGTLLVFRTTAPQDQKAIFEWVKYHGLSEDIMKSLSSLKSGEGWIWSPEWLNVTERVHFRQRETFDSGSTPIGGAKARAPATLADVNLKSITKLMADTIEKAKAEDPKHLKLKIRELEKAIADKDKQLDAFKPPHIPFKDGEAKEIFNDFNTKSKHSQKVIEKFVNHKTFRIQSSNGSLPKGEEATLAALIQFPNGLRREQLTVLTGYKRSSRDAYIQRLKEKGYAQSNRDFVQATEQGTKALPNFEPLPTGKDLQTYWMRRLPEGERKILALLIHAYPNAVERIALDAATGYQRSSRDAYLQRMKAKQLIIEPSRGMVAATENLF